ncbi:cytidylyltransferase domain-containing protein [Insolitispirillum peregrinum]|uniref:cytidylyltransferase domain-containing protein n=1 Tax=Insolitispirillum peregrinum TaxID=80876 RepID=UPI00360D2431
MIIAILQARMSSTRLPGKVMKPIIGKPMIQLHVERLRRCKSIDKIIIATSTDDSDTVIHDFAKQENILVARGPLHNVLERYAIAAQGFSPDHVLRVTADCPLADWRIIDKIVETHLELKTDYYSNTLPMSFPDGLDAEIMRYDVLQEAHQRASTAYQKEHVTPYIKEHHDYKKACLQRKTDLSEVRWTVDTPEDFLFTSKVYETLYVDNPAFTSEDILGLIKQQPSLQELNTENIHVKKILGEGSIFQSF